MTINQVSFNDEVISPARVVARQSDANFLSMRTKYVKRQAVRSLCDDLLEGRPTKIWHNGALYTLDDVLRSVCAHPLFPGAAMAAYNSNPHPLKDLVRRVAQNAICEHLCPGEAQELGFLP